jgi:tubulin-folding cofactor B
MESSNFVVVTEGWVNVTISSTFNTFKSEKKFAKDLTIGELKAKLEMITGGSHLDMRIEVFDDRANSGSVKVCDLSDDIALLGSYPVDSGMRLHVLDVSGKAAKLCWSQPRLPLQL